MKIQFLLSLVCAFALISLLPGCATTASRDVSPVRYTSVADVRAAVASGPARVREVSAQLSEIQNGFEKFSAESETAWRKRGYLDSEESDRMEDLLFRFTTALDALSDIAASLGGKYSPQLFPDENLKTAAHVLVVDAQFLLIYYRAQWVAEFSGDRVAIAKLNEPFFRSRIPAKTYEQLQLSATSGGTARRLQAAWVLFEHDSKDADIQHLVSADPAYSALVARVPDDYHLARAALEKLGNGGFENSIEHSEAAEIARKLGGEWGDLKYRSRCVLFKDVSRIKNPFEKVILFSPDQHARVQGLLRPGDVILTYTAGYMSDVFIPGTFKHGITFIGTPAQRRAAGVLITQLPEFAAPETSTVKRELTQATLKDGQEADVIEAVAEGVIFNNLGHIMDTHVNRMVVLRPKLTASERAAFLTDVFAFRGDSYDFLFDFADASRQVCTEVIYRGISGRGGIDFSLTERGGHPTLSADDVVNYHFRTNREHFDFVLYAEEDATRTGHHAKVLIGSVGEEKLKSMMAKSPHRAATTK